MAHPLLIYSWLFWFPYSAPWISLWKPSTILSWWFLIEELLWLAAEGWTCDQALVNYEQHLLQVIVIGSRMGQSEQMRFNSGLWTYWKRESLFPSGKLDKCKLRGADCHLGEILPNVNANIVKTKPRNDNKSEFWLNHLSPLFNTYLKASFGLSNVHIKKVK